MASSHAVLHKKLEELEAQITILLQNPMQLPLHSLTMYQIRRKVEFIKTLLAAEAESSSTSRDKALKEVSDKLAALEKNFVDWTTASVTAESNPRNEPEEIAERLLFIENSFKESDVAEAEEEPTEEPEHVEEIAERLSFIENNFKDFDASEESSDGTSEGTASMTLCEYCLNRDEEEEEGDAKGIVFGVTEEKIRRELEAIVAKANIERIVMELTEKAKRKEKREGSWLRRLSAIGAAVVVAAVGLAIADFGSMEEPVYLVPT